MATRNAVDEEVRAVGADRTRLLDDVERVQQRFGYLSNDAVAAVAGGLRVHAVEVEDMVSFYSFLDREKRGRFRIRLSRTPISFMQGALAVAEAFERTLGLSIGETSPDGMFTLEWTNWRDRFRANGAEALTSKRGRPRTPEILAAEGLRASLPGRLHVAGVLAL